MMGKWLQNLSSLVYVSNGEKDRTLLFARLAILLFVIVLPFQHNALWKNLAQVGMLLSAIQLIRQQRLKADLRSPIWIALLGLITVFFVTATLGSDPADSLSELRKHFLPGVLLLILVPVAFEEVRLSRLLLAICALVFVLRTGLVVGELAYYLPDLDTARSEGRYIKGFALDAGFYIPILLGLFLFGGRERWLGGIGLPVILVAMLLVQSRTPILAAAVAVLAMLLCLRSWRVLAVSVVTGLFVVSYFVMSQPAIAVRLASVFDVQTYRKAFDITNYKKPDDGLSARTAIWIGVLEITEPRRWQGYGFGWKKLGRTAVEQGYVAKWQGHQGDALAEERAWYFALPSDKVNPHNLYLQLYFESGLLGVAAYLLAVGIVLCVAARYSWCSQRENSIVAAVVMAYLIDHLILGFANGLLLGLGPSFLLLALLEAVRLREKIQ